MKKKIFIPLFIVLTLFLIALTVVIVFANSSYSFSKCRCIKTNDGQCIMVDVHSPIVLSNQTKNEKLFEGLSTGDEILVLHDAIEESYPGRTGAYFIKKLSDGDASKIREDVLYQLISLGWTLEGYDTPQPEKDDATDKKTPVQVDFSYKFYPASYKNGDYSKKYIIRSTDELSPFLLSDEFKSYDIVLPYDNKYFENNFLLLVYLVGPSGMTEFTVEDVVKDGDDLFVTIEEYTPSPHTDDLLTCFAFIELSKDIDVFDESFVEIKYESLYAFNFADDVFFNHLDENPPGYRTDGFVNTEAKENLSKEEIIELALSEVKLGYHSVSCYYDSIEDMYRIDVSESEPDENVCGGGASVYIYANGITKAILGWE